MPVPESYHEEIINDRQPGRFKLYHWATKERFIKYLNAGAILSKGTLWGMGLYTSTAGTLYVDAKLGFIDYVYFGVSPWPLMGMKSFYGYFGIEISFNSIKGREYFAYPFNTGTTWSKYPEEKKRSDISILLDEVWPSKTQNYGSEVVIRRQVKLTDDLVTAIHLPKGESADVEAILQGKELHPDKIKRYNMNPSQRTHYRLEFKSKDVFDSPLNELSHSDEHFILDDRDDSVIYFHVPETSAIVALKKTPDGRLFILNTDLHVGRIR